MGIGDKVLAVFIIVAVVPWITIPFKLDDIEKQLKKIANALQKGE